MEMTSTKQRSDSTIDLTPSTRENDNRGILIVAILITGLVALIAIVVAAVAMSRASTPSIVVNGGMGQPADGATVVSNLGQSGSNRFSNPRRWMVAIGHDFGAQEYFDDRGYIRGFSKAIVEAVCTASGMDCQTMWLPTKHCWNNVPGQHPTGGQGLLDRWVDACTSWYTTVERIHIFSISIPYLKRVPSYFFIKDGASFNVNDLAGAQIGFIKGWFSDEKCLARQESDDRKNYILKTNKITYADTPTELADLVKSGKVNAAFAGYDDMSGLLNSGIHALEDSPLNCALAGAGMMTRKDSDFNTYWNAGFEKLRSSGGFYKLCQDAQKQHGHKGNITCVD